MSPLSAVIDRARERVVDGKRVEFRGELISCNDWGCRAIGWSTIQISKWAVLPDGQLLEALRGQQED